MRRGEMPALRFADIQFARGLITLRGETTKSKKRRLVPISTQPAFSRYAWMSRATRSPRRCSSSVTRSASRCRTSTTRGCARPESARHQAAIDGPVACKARAARVRAMP
jgi:integrase